MKEEELKIKLKWGFEPICFVFLILIIFAPLIDLMFKGYSFDYILIILLTTLVLGIVAGSKIVLLKMEKQK